MARDYGSLGGRRTQSAGWQWFAFGLVSGLMFTGCIVAGFLGSIAFGVLNIPGVSIGPSPQPVVQIITATPLPATATPLPTETPLPTATLEVSQADVVVPTPTPSGGLSPNAIDNPPSADSVTAPSGSGIEGSVAVAPTAASGAPLLDTSQIGSDPAGGVATTAPIPNTTGGAAAQPQPSGELPAVLDLLQSDLVQIDGGSFQMGTTIQEAAEAVRECTDVFGGACTLAMAEDSAPPRTVQLSPYQIEITEVTYEQYIAFLNLLGPRSHLNGCDGQPCLATRNETDTSNVSFDGQTYDVNDVINNFPVVNVTWYGAKAYCDALGRRLPTEAEWEFAARGTDGRVYPWGNGPFDTSLAKTNRPIPESELDVGALPVGSLERGASPFGALDMSGNAAEWVNDWYNPNYYSQPDATGLDPQGPLGGTDRVIRGGSWDAVPFFARAVHRQHLPPTDTATWLGFRCAADPANAAADAQAAAGNQVIPAAPITPDTTQGLGGQTQPGGPPTLPPSALLTEEELLASPAAP